MPSLYLRFVYLFVIFILNLLILQFSNFILKTAFAQSPPSQDIKILNVKYFPLDPNNNLYIDGAITGYTHILPAWGNVVNDFTAALLQDLSNGSNGYLNYQLYEDREFLKAMPVSTNSIGEGVFYPDYMKILTEDITNICNYVDNLGVREIWIWGYHYGNIAPAESNMSMGRPVQNFWNFSNYGDISNSAKINDLPQCEKTFTVYNYNYNRGEALALHNHGHQIENVMAFAEEYIWQTKFRAPYGSTSQINRCGDIHNPPNATSEGDYTNTANFLSDCEDWRPDGYGEVTSINCHNWFGQGQNCDIDNEGRKYYLWWMQHIPGYGNNLTYQGRAIGNLWEYIGDLDTALNGKTYFDLNFTPSPIVATIAPGSAEEAAVFNMTGSPQFILGEKGVGVPVLIEDIETKMIQFSNFRFTLNGSQLTSQPIAVGRDVAPGVYTGTKEFTFGSIDSIVSTFKTKPFSFQITVPAQAVSVSPAATFPDGTITLDWTGIVSGSAADWAAIYKAADPTDAAHWQDWIFLNTCSRNRNDNLIKPIGTCIFQLSNLPPGSYEVRLLRNNTYEEIIRTNQFTINNTGMVVSPALTNSGGILTAEWNIGVGATNSDWLAIYKTSDQTNAANMKDWIFIDSCSKTSLSQAVSFGKCAFELPAVTPGTYELRLLKNNGFQEYARSNLFKVDNKPFIGITPLSTATNDAFGTISNYITIKWGNIQNPTNTDWATLYIRTDPTTAEQKKQWIFLNSCTQSAGSQPAASGSCTMQLPDGIAQNTDYEVRLLSNNTYNLMAVSNRITLTAEMGVSVSSPRFTSGQQMSISWYANPDVYTASTSDWLALFRKDDPTRQDKLIDWIFTSSCTKTQGAAALGKGTCSLTAPYNTTGTFEIRYLRNNTFELLSRSNWFTISQ